MPGRSVPGGRRIRTQLAVQSEIQIDKIVLLAASRQLLPPGLRDEAQDARNKIFDELRKLPGKDAYVAIMEIAHSEADASSRSWLSLSGRSLYFPSSEIVS
jgi:hypothetical protein